MLLFSFLAIVLQLAFYCSWCSLFSRSGHWHSSGTYRYSLRMPVDFAIILAVAIYWLSLAVVAANRFYIRTSHKTRDIVARTAMKRRLDL